MNRAIMKVLIKKASNPFGCFLFSCYNLQQNPVYLINLLLNYGKILISPRLEAKK